MNPMKKKTYFIWIAGSSGSRGRLVEELSLQSRIASPDVLVIQLHLPPAKTTALETKKNNNSSFGTLPFLSTKEIPAMKSNKATYRK